LRGFGLTGIPQMFEAEGEQDRYGFARMLCWAGSRGFSGQGNNWIGLLPNTGVVRDGLCYLLPHRIYRLLEYGQYLKHPAILPENRFQQESCFLDEMDPITRQKPVISINSDRGNAADSFRDVWNCDIPVVDEKPAVLEWLSPLEPREKHQTIGMDRVAGVGDWLLLTDQFTQWSQSRDGSAKPVLFCYGNPGAGKTYLRYGLWLPLESVDEAK